MVETLRMPNRRQIELGEKKVGEGNYQGAIAHVEHAVEFPLEDYSHWSATRKKNHMLATQLYIGAHNSLANEAEAAPIVASHLERQRDAIVTVYRNPRVQDEMKDYSNRMVEDEIAFTLTLAALTGNMELLDGAILSMDKKIAGLTDPTEIAIVNFRKEELLYQKSPKKTQLENLKAAYTEATTATAAKGDWEQTATLAIQYGLHEVVQGRLTHINAAQMIADKGATHSGDVVTTKLISNEVKKRTRAKIKHAQWQATIPEGADYTELALPEG